MKLLSQIISLTLPDTTPLQVSAILNLGITYIQKGFNRIFPKNESPCGEPCM